MLNCRKCIMRGWAQMEAQENTCDYIFEVLSNNPNFLIFFKIFVFFFLQLRYISVIMKPTSSSTTSIFKIFGEVPLANQSSSPFPPMLNIYHPPKRRRTPNLKLVIFVILIILLKAIIKINVQHHYSI